MATASLASAQPFTNRVAPASTNWLRAQGIFQTAGDLISSNKLDEAKRALVSASTNLPVPYGAMSTQFVQQLERIIQTSNLAARVKPAIALCGNLQGYAAVLHLKQTNKLNDDEDDSFGWAFFETGDTKTAISFYERKAAREEIQVYQDYYKKQIEMIQKWATNAGDPTLTLELVRERYMKNYERRVDAFGALRQLSRALPQAQSSTNGVHIYQEFIKCLSSLRDNAGREAWEDNLLADFKSDGEACAGVCYDRGIRAYYDSRDFDSSLKWMRKVSIELPGTKLWGDAQYSVGLILQNQKKYDEAIAAFNAIFSSKVNDYALVEGSSEDCKNYRFKSAMRVSECYESKNELASALEFARKATTQYLFVSYCSTCQKQTRESASKRVAELEEKIKQAK